MRVVSATFGFAFAAAVLGDVRDAQACGGCFPPPGEQQSVVTDHRMILLVSKEQTTLYDQIQYTGEPSSFAWVLPISGTVSIGLSADTLFNGLQNLTATAVQAPPTGCPSPTGCAFGDDSNEKGAPASAGSSSGGGVDVLARETVGPYETVQLRSTDPEALESWLTTNGFAIPADVKPVVAAYVGEHFDFLALKLLPGKGVNSMRPVRVTTQGASAVLPLRMVAAGTGANVGVSLWVVAEGRYEPQNFPFFTIKSEQLTWDWATSSSDYKEQRAQKTTELAGRGWEIESSIAVDRDRLESVVRNIGSFGGSSGSPATSSDYAPVEKDGQIEKTAEQVRTEDLKALFAGIGDGKERVTRMRADLAHSALTTDLLLVASADQSELSNIRQPKLEKGQPTCVVYQGCDSVGSAPRDEAIAQSTPNNSSSCESAGRRAPMHGGVAALGWVLAFFGLAYARMRRAQARQQQE